MTENRQELLYASVNVMIKPFFVASDQPNTYAETKVVNKGVCVIKHVAKIRKTLVAFF